MLPPIVIAPALAAAVWGAMTQSWQVAQVAAIVAAIATLLVGWPIVFWMLDNGRDGAVVRTVAGALWGASPFAAALVSGAIGLYTRSSDLEYVGWALTYGASVPYYGVVLWPKFAVFVALGVACGVAAMWALKLFQRPGNSNPEP